MGRKDAIQYGALILVRHIDRFEMLRDFRFRLTTDIRLE